MPIPPATSACHIILERACWNKCFQKLQLEARRDDIDKMFWRTSRKCQKFQFLIRRGSSSLYHVGAYVITVPYANWLYYLVKFAPFWHYSYCWMRLQFCVTKSFGMWFSDSTVSSFGAIPYCRAVLRLPLGGPLCPTIQQATSSTFLGVEGEWLQRFPMTPLAQQIRAQLVMNDLPRVSVSPVVLFPWKPYFWYRSHPN